VHRLLFCRGVIICELIVRLFVIEQNKKKSLNVNLWDGFFLPLHSLFYCWFYMDIILMMKMYLECCVLKLPVICAHT